MQEKDFKLFSFFRRSRPAGVKAAGCEGEGGGRRKIIPFKNEIFDIS